MPQIIRTTGPVGGFRKPLEIALDKTEKFNSRVQAVNAIGLSSAPKALAMLAIISNSLSQDDGIRGWSEYWLADLKNNYKLSDADVNQIRELLKSNPNIDDPDVIRLISMFSSEKSVAQEYDLDKLEVRSSLPWSQETLYQPDELPPDIRARYDAVTEEIRLTGLDGDNNGSLQGLSEEEKKELGATLARALAEGQYGVYKINKNDNALSELNDRSNPIRVLIDLCKQAKQSPGLASIAVGAIQHMVTPDMQNKLEAISHLLTEEDRTVLREFNLIKNK